MAKTPLQANHADKAKTKRHSKREEKMGRFKFFFKSTTTLTTKLVKDVHQVSYDFHKMPNKTLIVHNNSHKVYISEK